MIIKFQNHRFDLSAIYVLFAFFPLLAVEWLRLPIAGLKIPVFSLLVVILLIGSLIGMSWRMSVAISPRGRLFLATYFLFFVGVLASLFRAEVFEVGMSFVIKSAYIFILAVFLLTYRHLNADKVKVIAKIISIISAVIVGLLLYRYVIDFGIYKIGIDWEKPTGTGANQLSLYLTIVTPIILWLYISSRNWISVHIVSLTIHTSALILTMSKAAWLIFAVTTAWWLLVYFTDRRGALRRDSRISTLKIIFLAGGVVWVIGIVLAQEGLREIILDNFQSIITLTDVEKGGTSTELRRDFTSRSLDFFLENPLFGIGITNFIHRVGYVTHNSYLQILSELGLFGFIPFLLLLWIIFWTAFSMRTIHTFEYGFAQAAVSAILYLLFINAAEALIIFVPGLICLLFGKLKYE